MTNVASTYAYDRNPIRHRNRRPFGMDPNYLYDQWGNRAVQTGSYIPNPNGTETALTQLTNNQWLGTGSQLRRCGRRHRCPRLYQ
jgi:hypothetical protein